MLNYCLNSDVFPSCSRAVGETLEKWHLNNWYQSALKLLTKALENRETVTTLQKSYMYSEAE